MGRKYEISPTIHKKRYTWLQTGVQPYFWSVPHARHVYYGQFFKCCVKMAPAPGLSIVLYLQLHEYLPVRLRISVSTPDRRQVRDIN